MFATIRWRFKNNPLCSQWVWFYRSPMFSSVLFFFSQHRIKRTQVWDVRLSGTIVLRWMIYAAAAGLLSGNVRVDKVFCVAVKSLSETETDSGSVGSSSSFIRCGVRCKLHPVMSSSVSVWSASCSSWSNCSQSKINKFLWLGGEMEENELDFFFTLTFHSCCYWRTLENRFSSQPSSSSAPVEWRCVC